MRTNILIFLFQIWILYFSLMDWMAKFSFELFEKKKRCRSFRTMKFIETFWSGWQMYINQNNRPREGVVSQLTQQSVLLSRLVPLSVTEHVSVNVLYFACCCLIVFDVCMDEKRFYSKILWYSFYNFGLKWAIWTVSPVSLLQIFMYSDFLSVLTIFFKKL